MFSQKRPLFNNLFLGCLLLGMGFSAGVIFQRTVSVDTVLMELGIRHPLSVPQRNAATAQIDATAFANNKSDFVALVLGQSNAGSHGATPVGVMDNAYQFWQGEVYPAKDPLYGSSGSGGSIWMTMNPMLLEQHSKVLWVPTVIGLTSIADGTPHTGRYHHYLQDTLDAVREQAIDVDAIFWVQGEADARAGMSEDTYYQALQELVGTLQQFLPATPIFLAKATRCRTTPPYLPIRTAIDRIVSEVEEVKEGIDLDQLGLEYRFDGCHLNKEGLQLAAELSHELLTAQPRQP